MVGLVSSFLIWLEQRVVLSIWELAESMCEQWRAREAAQSKMWFHWRDNLLGALACVTLLPLLPGNEKF